MINQERNSYWFSPRWWVAQIKMGLVGPRAVVSIVVAVIGLPCVICQGYVAGCPIHIPVLALVASFFSVRQERVINREEGGIVGAVSGVVVALIHILISVTISTCGLLISLFLDYPVLPPEFNISAFEKSLIFLISYIAGLVGNIIVLIIAGIIGYFTGYLNVSAAKLR